MVSGHRAQSSEAKAVREKQIEKLFRELDTGNKGYLDKESLSEGFRLLNHRKTSSLLSCQWDGTDKIC